MGLALPKNQRCRSSTTTLPFTHDIVQTRTKTTESADANDDGRVNLSDAIVTLLHLFGGRTLPPPFGDCGVDPTTDDLDCREFPGCF